MKIIIDTRWIRSLKIDGIASFAINLTRELLNTDKNNNYILLIDSLEVSEYLEKYISEDIKKYFYKVDCSVNSLKNFYLLPGIISSIKPDIFFSPNYPLFSPVIKDCFHIGLVHDLIPLIFPEMFRRASFKYKLFYCNRFIQGQSLKSLNGIVTVSKSTKNDLIKYLGQDPEKIKVIVEGSNYVQEGFTPSLIYELQQFYKITGDYFLFIGRHEIYKNIRTLIKVYNQLPETIKSKYGLVIVGKFSEFHTPELRSLVKELHEEEKIYFIDSVMPEILLTFYKNAKLLIHLSLYEGFGLTILEAMSLGIPVIASDRSSMPEVVGDAGFLVNPDDYEQIIARIIKIIEDDVLYKELSKKGIERAKYFTWHKSAEQILEIFQEINEQRIK